MKKYSRIIPFLVLLVLALATNIPPLLCAGDEAPHVPSQDVVHSDAEQIPHQKSHEMEEIPVDDDDDDAALEGSINAPLNNNMLAMDTRGADIVRSMDAGQKKKPMNT